MNTTTIYWEHTLSIDLLAQLKDLPLYGMAEAWSDIKAEIPQRRQDLAPEILLKKLINGEKTHPDGRGYFR